MIFFKIMKKCWAHSLHLPDGHFNNVEERFNGIVRLIDQLVSLLRSLIFVILDNLQQEGILVLESFINGSLGDTHLLGKGIHGHALDSIFTK